LFKPDKGVWPKGTLKPHSLIGQTATGAFGFTLPDRTGIKMPATRTVPGTQIAPRVHSFRIPAVIVQAQKGDQPDAQDEVNEGKCLKIKHPLKRLDKARSPNAQKEKAAS